MQISLHRQRKIEQTNAPTAETTYPENKTKKRSLERSCLLDRSLSMDVSGSVALTVLATMASTVTSNNVWSPLYFLLTHGYTMSGSG